MHTYTFQMEVHNVDCTAHFLVFAATIWTLLCGYAKEKNIDSGCFWHV